MRVVVDTNVIVSGLINPNNAPGRIVMMGVSEDLAFCYDGRIVTEYRDVLERPKFKFKVSNIVDFIHQIENGGHVVAALPLKKSLPDLGDEPFLVVAIAGNAECLITGNLKHYPVSARQGMRIVSPSQFLSKYYS